MMTIDVTQGDIDEARRLLRQMDRLEKAAALGTCCPIGIAAARAADRVMYVGGIFMDDGDGFDTVYRLPNRAQVFIRDFDNGNDVAPFEFDVDKKTTARRLRVDCA